MNRGRFVERIVTKIVAWRNKMNYIKNKNTRICDDKQQRGERDRKREKKRKKERERECVCVCVKVNT